MVVVVVVLPVVGVGGVCGDGGVDDCGDPLQQKEIKLA